jgi:hypothetical protein
MPGCIKCGIYFNCACNLDMNMHSKTYGMCNTCQSAYNSSTTVNTTTISPNPYLVKPQNFWP